MLLVVGFSKKKNTLYFSCKYYISIVNYLRSSMGKHFYWDNVIRRAGKT